MCPKYLALLIFASNVYILVCEPSETLAIYSSVGAETIEETQHTVGHSSAVSLLLMFSKAHNGLRISWGRNRLVLTSKKTGI
jgi:hypothetical protein